MRLRKLLATAAVALGTSFAAVSANAALIGFNDVVDGDAGFGTLITTAAPLSFTHNINGDINTATDTIIFANLSIKISDPFGGDEALTITLDLTPQGLGAVANSGFTFHSFDTGTSILTLGMLQSDGLLDVTLAVGTGQSIYFQRSDLSGTAESREVPEPATLAVLGMGLLGLGIARRRQTAKA